MDHYAVIGNPVAHSKSPQIHTAFARATGQDISYERLLAPLDGFAQTLAAFRRYGSGANITLPFKEAAFSVAEELSERAGQAGAVNTLSFDAGKVFGDNTDGAGLVADLRKNLGFGLAGRRILLVGAGGAARGVLHPLAAQRPQILVIANRTAGKAKVLAASAQGVEACALDELWGQRFDLVINATSASLDGKIPVLPDDLFEPGALAYDLMYGQLETPFLAWARRLGVSRRADGLGMLVEQAAESFFVWRRVQPDTAPVLAMLRHSQEPISK